MIDKRASRPLDIAAPDTTSSLMGSDRMMLSVDGVAAHLGLSAKTVRRAIDDGRLRAFKPCGRLLIAPADVRAWLEASQVEPRVTPGARERSRPRSTTTQTGSLRELLDHKGDAA